MKYNYYAICAASSGVWAAIAHVIGHYALPRDIVWGGIVVAPLLGLVAGAIYRRAYKFSRAGRVAMSLLTLYVTAALFGLAVGVFDAVQGLPRGYVRGTEEVIYQGLAATLYGITITGYVVILWPLSYLNHWLVGRFAKP